MIQAPDWSAPLFMGSHSTRLTIFVPPHIDPSPVYAMKIISLGSRQMVQGILSHSKKSLLYAIWKSLSLLSVIICESTDKNGIYCCI